MYWPLASLTKTRASPVALLVVETVTPGTAAPCWSVIFPVSVPNRSCAIAVVLSARPHRSSKAIMRAFMGCSLVVSCRDVLARASRKRHTKLGLAVKSLRHNNLPGLSDPRIGALHPMKCRNPKHRILLINVRLSKVLHRYGHTCGRG